MDKITVGISILFLLNLFLACVLIFLERKDPTSTLAWLMVLILFPSIGFIFYLIFSQSMNMNNLFKLKAKENNFINLIKDKQINLFRNNKVTFKDKSIFQYKDMIYMHLMNSSSLFTQDNEIEFYTDGKTKFEELIKSIENAKDHIHMLYYIIRNDSIGKRVINALIQKAKEGVEVRLLYDDLGSRFISRKLLKKLKDAGGQVVPFFASRIPYINFRINYRNHRKIVIIDGTYAFIGGFNIGNEYLGKNKNFGFWRDTHLKIKGSAVHDIQTRFILDWRQASYIKINNIFKKYYPKIKTNGNAGVQIVSSGPDSKDEQIKYGYIKLINSAKESIYIQTPYFIPDDSVIEALKIASLSGVDVKIMIPNKPDHIFVYWATYSYIGELLKFGVKVYIYEQGFLHAKTFVVDGKVASVGTANVDIRSFKYNFEVNAFIYDSVLVSKLKNVFEEDQKHCKELTQKKYLERPTYIKIKESISRLLSPIL